MFRDITSGKRGVGLALAAVALLVCAAGAVTWGMHARVARADDPAVEIKGFLFNPAEIAIATSGTVTWTNADGATHTVSSTDGAFDSGRLNSGGTFTLDAATLVPGTYAYQCNIHTSMKGTLIIE